MANKLPSSIIPANVKQSGQSTFDSLKQSFTRQLFASAGFCLISFFGLSASAHADFLGIFIGGGYWNQSYGGFANGDISLDNDIGLADDGGINAYIKFEHPVPLIPNFRVAMSQIEVDESGVLSSATTLGSTNFTAGQSVTSTIELTHTDFTLYYEIVDIGFDLDIGVSARVLDGGLTIDNTTVSTDTTLILGYTAAKIGLPFSGYYIRGEASGFGLDSANTEDYAISIGWETENFIFPEFGVELGYRNFSIDASAADIDFDLDMEVDGAFINFTGHI